MCWVSLQYDVKQPQLCVRQGIWKTSIHELQPIEDNVVESIFPAGNEMHIHPLLLICIRSASNVVDNRTKSRI